jgi:hypothetical protein
MVAKNNNLEPNKPGNVEVHGFNLIVHDLIVEKPIFQDRIVKDPKFIEEIVTTYKVEEKINVIEVDDVKVNRKTVDVEVPNYIKKDIDVPDLNEEKLQKIVEDKIINFVNNVFQKIDLKTFVEKKIDEAIKKATKELVVNDVRVNTIIKEVTDVKITEVEKIVEIPKYEEKDYILPVLRKKVFFVDKLPEEE